MTQNMDFSLYFNIMFFSTIVFGFIGGYIKGSKKTLFSLITLLIFYAFFFITIDVVVSELWILPIPFAFDYLITWIPDLANVTTIGEAVFKMLEINLGDQIGDTLSNAMFVSLVTGLAQFVLKLVYTLLYFTIGLMIYRMFVFFIRTVFIKNNKIKTETKTKRKKGRRIRLTRKEKKQQKKDYKEQLKADKKRELKEKKPLLGAFYGMIKGGISAFLTLIVLGGILNMSESLLLIVSDTTGDDTVVYEETVYLSSYFNDYSISPTQLDSELPIPSETEEQLAQARDMIDAFNTNIFVRNASKLVVESQRYSDPIELHLYLFDSVFSFNYDDNRIMFRKEISVFSEAGNLILNSEFMKTNDISDITSDEIIFVFNQISESDLITTIIPLGIEVGSDYFDMPVNMPIDELYAVDWENELMTLGTIFAVGFDLVNTAGILDDSADLETITLDGSEVKNLFDSLADSELATLTAYIAVEPFLEKMDGDISAIITVPTDLEWSDEFSAFGEITEAIFDTGISIGNLQDGDPSVLVSSLSNMDLTVLLNSQIISHALKNIFSGEAGIEGFDIIVVPDDIVWFDVYDDDTLISRGELYNLLNALNSITDIAEGFDFNDLDFSIIADFDDDTIDALISSDILSATFGQVIIDSVGDVLVIPNSALSEIIVDTVAKDVISKTEIKKLFQAITILGFGDLDNMEFNVSIIQNLGLELDPTTLDQTKSDKLLGSKIVYATLSDMLFGQTEGINSPLVVPYFDVDLNPIRIYDTVDDLEYLSTDELTDILQALLTLDISNFDDVNSLNLGLLTDNSSVLLESAIFHATISKQVFDLGTDIVTIPYKDIDENNIRITVGNSLLGTDTEYITKTEINHIFDGLEVLGINDISSFDGTYNLLNLDGEPEKQDKLLSSASIHATISKTLLDLNSAILIIPHYTQEGETSGNEIRITVSSGFEYVVKDEIKALINSFNAMGYHDLDSFNISLDSSEFFNERAILLSSSSIQATLSDKMLNDTAGELVIPDVNINTTPQTTIRLINSDVTYIEINEMNSILDVLEELGLTDFSTMDFDITNIFTIDHNVLFSSASIQATISANVLSNSLDETAPNGSTTIIVPTYFRENIMVDSTPNKQIELVELEALLDAFEVLGVGDFSGGMNATTITGLSDTDLDVMLISGSIHTTIDNIMRGNSNINSEIPDLAITNVLYKNDIITKTEIKTFIKATQTVSSGSISSISFDVNTLTSLTPSEQDTVASSMIVRNILTDDLETAATLKSPPYVLANTDYMNDDENTFLTKAAVLAIIS